MKVGSIKDNVLIRAKVLNLIGRLIEPIIFDPVKLGAAKTGMHDQLAHRVTFCNPKLKPVTLFSPFNIRLFVYVCFVTCKTLESLFMVRSLAILLNM